MHNKMDSETNKLIFLLTDLKWSSQHQSGLAMAQLGPDWPDFTLRGPEVHQVAPTGAKGVFGPIGGQLGHHKDNLTMLRQTILSQYEYGHMYFRTPFYFAN